jgi:hypothetical protein
MQDRYTKKYVKEWRIGQWEHRYEIIGAHGACHLSIQPYRLSDGPIEHSAGLEMHYRRPPKYMNDCAPSHAKCFLLEGPCWHDGTSLYAQEYFVPMFLRGDEDGIFSEMIRWCDGRLEEEKEQSDG